VRGHAGGPASDAEGVGRGLAEELLARGGEAILAELLE
jgi:hypothetical protein